MHRDVQHSDEAVLGITDSFQKSDVAFYPGHQNGIRDWFGKPQLMQAAYPIRIAIEYIVAGRIGGLLSSNHEAADLSGSHLLIIELQRTAEVGQTKYQHELGFFRRVL